MSDVRQLVREELIRETHDPKVALGLVDDIENVVKDMVRSAIKKDRDAYTKVSHTYLGKLLQLRKALR